jgi:hypothetical protein
VGVPSYCQREKTGSTPEIPPTVASGLPSNFELKIFIRQAIVEDRLFLQRVFFYVAGDNTAGLTGDYQFHTKLLYVAQKRKSCSRVQEQLF